MERCDSKLPANPGASVCATARIADKPAEARFRCLLCGRGPLTREAGTWRLLTAAAFARIAGRGSCTSGPTRPKLWLARSTTDRATFSLRTNSGSDAGRHGCTRFRGPTSSVVIGRPLTERRSLSNAPQISARMNTKPAAAKHVMRDGRRAKPFRRRRRRRIAGRVGGPDHLSSVFLTRGRHCRHWA